MNNVNEDQPVVFETRWAMSYLRGPLTRKQIQQLVEKDADGDPNKIEEPCTAPLRPAPEPIAADIVEPTIDPRQLVPDSVEQFFMEPNERVLGEDRLIYRPALLGSGRLHFVKSTYDVDEWVEKTFLLTVFEDEIPDEIWEEADLVKGKLFFESEPVRDSRFADLPPELQKSRNYRSWNKELKEYLYRSQEMNVWKCEELDQYSEPNQTLGDFKVQLEQRASEKRDDEVETLRKKYENKFATLRDQIRRAGDRVEVEKEQYQQSRLSSVLSVGSTLMGALLGRKISRKASTSVRSYSRASKEKSDIDRAKDNLDAKQDELEKLSREFDEAVNELQDKLAVENLEFVELTVTPRKSDISVKDFGVCWLPFRVSTSGIAEAIY